MKLHNIYFSAKGTTKVCADCISKELGFEAESHNWLYDVGDDILDIPREDVLLFSMPVYGGFIPSSCVEKAKLLKGNNTPAIIAAVYGNRHYDDALIQMKDILESKGFIVIAAGGFLAEHSIFSSVAKGRPDNDDKEAMAEFAHNILKMLDSDISGYNEIVVPGNTDYKANYVNSIPFKPKGSEACINCGDCVKACPVNAISIENPKATDSSLCINCGACISSCNVGARNYYDDIYEMAKKNFENKCSEYRKPEMFYAEI